MFCLLFHFLCTTGLTVEQQQLQAQYNTLTDGTRFYFSYMSAEYLKYVNTIIYIRNNASGKVNADATLAAKMAELQAKQDQLSSEKQVSLSPLSLFSLMTVQQPHS